MLGLHSANDEIETLRLFYDVKTGYERLQDDINDFVDNIIPVMERPGTIEHNKAIMRKAELIENANGFLKLLDDVSHQDSVVDIQKEEEDGIALVLFWVTVSIIKLHASLTTDEVVYDGFYTHFEEALGHAEHAYDYIRKRGKKMTTSLALPNRGMPILFWVAWKCRDAILRRRAADLLQSSWRTYQFECDGYWISAIEKVIDIETGSMPTADSTPVMDQNRIYALKVSPDCLSKGNKQEAIIRYKVGKSTRSDSSLWIEARTSTSV